MHFDTVEYLLKLLFWNYSVPLVIFDKKKRIIYPKNLKEDFGDLDTSLLSHFNPNKIILIKDPQRLYSIFGAHIENKECAVLFGPKYTVKVRLWDYNKEGGTDDAHLRGKDEEESDFLNWTKFVFSLLNDKVPSQEMPFKQVESGELSVFNKIFQENLEDRRREDIDNSSPELEQRFIQSVISNDRKEFDWLFSKLHAVYLTRLHSNRLVSLKYKYVALVTILTRVSINEGVNVTKAYSLSDSLIQNLESINSLKNFVPYLKESCLQFRKLIQVSKNSGQSVLVRNIKEYISSHIDQKITIDELAESLHKSKNYISVEFRKQTGLTIHSYILHNKIEKVKRLLVETDLDISSIAQKIGFSDQSHLNRVFKKAEKITPKVYRKKYKSVRIL